MRIQGLQRLTLLDFPERTACTVFTAGCNFRCPFCHNASLVVDIPKEPELSEEEFFSFLGKRKGILDGVCISGGEPLLQPDIENFMRKIKDMGFAIKLDTNGSFPEKLKSLVEKGLVDYVAMDIKNSPEKYPITCGGDHLEAVKESVALLMNRGVEYEFRTTVVRQLHTPEDMEKIGVWLSGAKRYYIQQFVDSGNLIGEGLSALSPSEMEILRQSALPYIPTTALRGIG